MRLPTGNQFLKQWPVFAVDQWFPTGKIHPMQRVSDQDILKITYILLLYLRKFTQLFSPLTTKMWAAISTFQIAKIAIPDRQLLCCWMNFCNWSIHDILPPNICCMGDPVGSFAFLNLQICQGLITQIWASSNCCQFDNKDQFCHWGIQQLRDRWRHNPRPILPTFLLSDHIKFSGHNTLVMPVTSVVLFEERTFVFLHHVDGQVQLCH